MPSEFQTNSTETSADLLELDIHFISNSAEIPKNDLVGLDEIYELLSKNKDYRIELASYTDDVGNEENNMRLSQRRSDAVKAFLVSKGINEAQIVAKGYGEKQPKASNDTDVGRASNRRTELRFIK
jgi:OOP family OmpA-OmpF porin